MMAFVFCTAIAAFARLEHLFPLGQHCQSDSLNDVVESGDLFIELGAAERVEGDL